MPPAWTGGIHGPWGCGVGEHEKPERGWSSTSPGRRGGERAAGGRVTDGPFFLFVPLSFSRFFFFFFFFWSVSVRGEAARRK
ncbi:CHL1 isoform 7 [Pan troglodytes]|uniref:CHL1 isoform 7 n=1 Tax=Pan troglodytes TaxID=9598 RepID=A0A2J8M0G4_PANTR|nr:CHL1 isoform 7 [Pan troglodytes]